ncbi:Mec3 [Kluyveromyces lactis]|nr:Mec3 [Kluyveromyces lactis]
MKLKLSIQAGTEDYSLFRTTLITVSKLRKTCILRFTSSRLVIISTPNSTGTVIDQGQVWCTVPHDVFDTYVVNSIREDNRVAMECPCDTIVGVLRKFDKCNASQLTIKLVRLVTVDKESEAAAAAHNTDNTLCGLSFSFQDTRDERTIQHNIKVGVKLLYNAQDEKIVEPTVNYVGILMLQLPSHVSEWGPGFNAFFKRIERYGNVNALKIHGEQLGEKGSLKVIVDEFDWKLNIAWKGPLDAMLNDMESDDSQSDPRDGTLRHNGEANAESSPSPAACNEMQIEDSDVLDTGIHGKSIERHSTMQENASARQSQDKLKGHEVIVRVRDWKVCSKLYESFEEVVLVISHDDSCVFHCSLERGIDRDENNKEKGQIIYYISKCKSLN